jgi:hypothetical protein
VTNLLLLGGRLELALLATGGSLKVGVSPGVGVGVGLVSELELVLVSELELVLVSELASPAGEQPQK